MKMRAAFPQLDLVLIALMVLCVATVASAAEIGQIKISSGQVSVERDGRVLPGPVGTRLQTADTVKTGADGSIGITLDDDALLSAGPNSALSLGRFACDPGAVKVRFDASREKG